VIHRFLAVRAGSFRPTELTLKAQLCRKRSERSSCSQDSLFDHGGSMFVSGGHDNQGFTLCGVAQGSQDRVLVAQDAGLVCRGPVYRVFLRATAQAGPARFRTRETPPKLRGVWTGHPRKVIARVQRSATRRHVRGLTLAHKCHSRESHQVLVL
jgi:hypothetical protein